MKKNYVKIGIIVALSAFLAYLQLAQARCNSDDAGTYIYLYNIFELGNRELNLSEILNPRIYSSSIAYLLNAGGSGTFISLIYLSVWYGIAVFFTLLLTVHGRNAKWLIALTVFILMPYSSTNRYHMVVAFVTLFAIWALQCYTETQKKWILLVVGLISLYTLIFVDDRVLFILFLLVPLIVYFAIYLFQDENKRKYLYLIIFSIILVAGVLKCADIIAVKLLGRNTGITDAFGGYGGDGYYTWINVETLFSKGIPSLFSSLFVQWNIPIQGGMIQVNSLYWGVRIIIAGLAIVALISRWIDILKKRIKNVEFLDALAVICTTVVLGANAFNGMIWYYEITDAPMNRYASVGWFLLAVILVRWLDERFSDRMIYHNISINLFLGVAFALLSVGYLPPELIPREAIASSVCAVELDYLQEHDEAYKYGLGSYWKTNCVTAATNAEHVICSGWIEEDKLVPRKGDAFYMDGGNYFNFIVSSLGNEMTISPENIEKIRGDYIDIYSNGDTIYMYDYDIRFDTTVVMDTAGMGYELTDTIIYSLDLPVGTSRIEITTAAKDNLLLDVLENEDIINIRIGSKGESIATAEVTCLQNTQIGLSVGRREDIFTELYKVEIKRVAGAVSVDRQQTKLPLNEGRYIVTFAGEDLKDMEINWNIDGEVTQLTNGRVKRRYLLDVSREQTVEYSIISDNAEVDRIYYENEILFEE